MGSVHSAPLLLFQWMDGGMEVGDVLWVLSTLTMSSPPSSSCSFTDVYAGWPGSTSAASVLHSSELYMQAEDRPDGFLFPREVSVITPGL